MFFHVAPSLRAVSTEYTERNVVITIVYSGMTVANRRKRKNTIGATQGGVWGGVGWGGGVMAVKPVGDPVYDTSLCPFLERPNCQTQGTGYIP